MTYENITLALKPEEAKAAKKLKDNGISLVSIFRLGLLFTMKKGVAKINLEKARG